MADKKVTELTAATSMATTDLFPIVADPSGSPITKKITKANMLTDIPAANLLIASQATGDLLYASSAAVWARKGIGTTGQILTVAGGIPSWAIPSMANSPFGKTVSASTATANADYNCDGTTDDVEIQAALTAVHSAGGGKVYLTGGTFNIAAELTVYSNTSLVGSGTTNTILKRVSGNNINIITISGSKISAMHFTIDGNYAADSSGQNGVHVLDSQNVFLFDITSHDNALKGIVGETAAANLTDVTCLSCITYSNRQDGITIASYTVASGFICNRWSNINCESYSNTQYGFGVVEPATTYNYVYNTLTICCKSHNNGTYGIENTGGYGSKIVDNIVEYNGYHGINLGNDSGTHTTWQAIHCLVQGNTVRNNAFVTAGYSGINMQYTKYTKVIDNQVYDDQTVHTQSYGITKNTSANDIVKDNLVYSNLTSNSNGNTLGETAITGATPDVTHGEVYTLTQSGATNVTAFTGGIAGQTITIIAGDANSTVVDGSSLKLAGNYAMTGDDVLVLYYNGTNWYEKSRSTN